MRSPRLWWIVAVAAALGVNLAALAATVLPALPIARRHPGLVAHLPAVRLALLAAGTLGALAVASLLVSRRAAPARAVAGLLVVLGLLGVSTQYGYARTMAVTARPPAVREVDGQRVFDHGAFDAVLARFVDARGMVDYRALVADRADLDEYVGQLASTSPVSHPDLFPTEEDRMAYWINAYNALILRAVVDAYPVASVKDIMAAHGVFSRLYFPVGGRKMTLDDIEKGVLLKEFHDPRVHFALTCASLSCPRLDRRAFHAEGLSARLDAEGRDFLNSPDGVQLDADRDVVRLSSYFKWYGSDFGADPVAFARRYLDDAHRGALDGLATPGREFLGYDWRLNDAGAAWAAR